MDVKKKEGTYILKLLEMRKEEISQFDPKSKTGLGYRNLLGVYIQDIKSDIEDREIGPLVQILKNVNESDNRHYE